MVCLPGTILDMHGTGNEVFSLFREWWNMNCPSNHITSCLITHMYQFWSWKSETDTISVYNTRIPLPSQLHLGIKCMVTNVLLFNHSNNLLRYTCINTQHGHTHSQNHRQHVSEKLCAIDQHLRSQKRLSHFLLLHNRFCLFDVWIRLHTKSPTFQKFVGRKFVANLNVFKMIRYAY